MPNSQGPFHLCPDMFRYGDNEQASPTGIAIEIDAGLEGDVPVTKVNAFEHLLGAQGFILFVDVAEGTVGAGGLQGLIVQDFGDDEGFDLSIAKDEAYFLPNCKL